MRYLYLSITLMFMIPWALLLHIFPAYRKQLYTGSLVGFLIAVPSAYLYTHDWWLPLTLTSSKIGLEDLLIGIFIGGISVVNIKPFFYQSAQKREEIQTKRIAYIATLGLASMALLMFIFNINSYVSTIITCTIMSLIMLGIRRDLIYVYFLSGFSLLLLAMPIYLIATLIFPGWTDIFYFDAAKEYAQFLWMPVVEVIWYFLIGGLFGISYEIIHGVRLAKLHKNN